MGVTGLVCTRTGAITAGDVGKQLEFDGSRWTLGGIILDFPNNVLDPLKGTGSEGLAKGASYRIVRVDDGAVELCDGTGGGLLTIRAPGNPHWSHLNDVSVATMPQWVHDDLRDAAWADRRQLRLLYVSLVSSTGGVCALANYVKELADQELQDFDRSCAWDDACGYDSANRKTFSSRMCGGIPPVTLQDDGVFPDNNPVLHAANVAAVEALCGRMGEGCSRAFMEVSIWNTGRDSGHGCVLVFDRTAQGGVHFGFFDANASGYSERADYYFRDHLAGAHLRSGAHLQYLGPLLPTSMWLVEAPRPRGTLGSHYSNVRSYGMQTDGSCVAWAYYFVYLCIINPGVPCTDVARYAVLQSLGGPSEPAGKAFLDAAPVHHFRVKSGGINSRDNSYFWYNDRPIPDTPNGPGFNLVVVDPKTLVVNITRSFDMAHAANATDMHDFVQNLPHGSVVLVSVRGEASTNADPHAYDALKLLGGTGTHFGFGHSFALVGRRGVGRPAVERAAANDDVEVAGLDRVMVPSLEGYDKHSSKRIYGWMAYVRAHCLQLAKTLTRRPQQEDRVRGLRHLLPVATLCAHHMKLFPIGAGTTEEFWLRQLGAWHAETGRQTTVLHSDELNELKLASANIFNPLRTTLELGDVKRTDVTTVLEHVLPHQVLKCVFMLQTQCESCSGMVNPFEQYYYYYRGSDDRHRAVVWHETCRSPLP